MCQSSASAELATGPWAADWNSQGNARYLRRPSLMPPLRIDIPSDDEHEFCSQKETLVLKPQQRRVSCFSHQLEQTFYDSFTFLFVSGPDYGLKSPKGKKLLHKIDAKISEMKPPPKFIALCGGLSTDSTTDVKSSIETVNKAFSKSAVKIVRVGTSNDLASLRSMYPDWSATIDTHRQWFGDAYFAFWISGVSFLVVGSAFHDHLQFEKEQSEWLSSELLQNDISSPKYTIALQEKLHVQGSDDMSGIADNSCTAHIIQRHLAMNDTFYVFCGESKEGFDHPRLIATPKVTEAVEQVRVVRVSAQGVTSSVLYVDDLTHYQ